MGSLPVIITLAHFCDKHGPQAIMVTQRGSLGTFGDELLLPEYSTSSYCESCLLKLHDERAKSIRTFVENAPYVSTQYSAVRYQLLNLIIRRCFSEETLIYDGMPLVFQDESRGSNLVVAFKLYDENARGNERRYCFILTIDSHANDAMHLISENWNLIVGGFHKMIQYIEDVHSKLIDKVQTEKETKINGGFKPFTGRYLKANKEKISRNLVSLTSDPYLFIRLHNWNVFLLNSLT